MQPTAYVFTGRTRPRPGRRTGSNTAPGQATGTDDTAIVLSADAPGEIGSTLDHNAVTLIGSVPQVVRGVAGHSIASPELPTIVSLPKAATVLCGGYACRAMSTGVRRSQHRWAVLAACA
ncbi:MAG TPA: hypothetical protein VFX20_07205 [Steroidobacteraceae bacterium]|nr:hypothetical protein [Steroidobacteraceae bacterium]